MLYCKLESEFLKGNLPQEIIKVSLYQILTDMYFFFLPETDVRYRRGDQIPRNNRRRTSQTWWPYGPQARGHRTNRTMSNMCRYSVCYLYDSIT